jgi:uncharacterized protein (DUF486 family)
MVHLISNPKNDNLDTHVKEPHDRRWLRTILIIGAIYCLDGIVFGMFAGWSKSHTMVIIWRLAAWLTCAVLFAAHIWYEHYRFNNSSYKTALYASSAAAIGAFGLSVAANIHGQFVSSANQILLALSLVIWPILTAVPAFIVAFVITSVLQHFHKRVLPK